MLGWLCLFISFVWYSGAYAQNGMLPSDSSINRSAISQVLLTEQEQRFIEQHPQIVLGSEVSWEPYVIKKATGKIEGYDAEVLHQINQLTGAHFQLRLGRWEEMQRLAQRGEIDGLSTGGIHPERKTYLNFSDVYISMRKMVLVKQNNPLNIRSIKDLDGKTIAIHKPNLVDKKIANRFVNSTIIYCDTIEDMIREVILGKADATFGNASTEYMAAKLGLPYMTLAFSLDDQLQLAFGVRKDWPEAVSILNKGLKAIGAQELNRLKQKWFYIMHQVPDAALEPDLIELNEAQQRYLTQKGRIKLCVDNDWLPLERFNRGRYEGIFADLHQLIYQKFPIQTEIIPTANWQESILFAKNRQCDVLTAASKTESRQLFMDFTDAVFSFPIVILGHYDQPYLNHIDQILDRKFAIRKGYAATELLKRRYPTIQIVEVDSTQQGLDLIKSGTVFGLIDTGVSLGYYLLHHLDHQVKIIAQLEEKYDLAIATRNDEPVLNTIYQMAIDHISVKEKNAILNKWLLPDKPKAIDQRWFAYLIAAFVVILMLIIFIYRYKAYQVKKEHQSILIHHSKMSSLGEMVGNIAHQWRQPIAELSSKQMVLETKLCLQKEISGQELAHHFKGNNLLFEHLSQTLDTFLNLYRSNDDTPGYFNLKDEIEKTLTTFKGMFEKQSITVVTQLESITIYGNKGHFNQAFLAILTNAKQASESKQDDRRLWLDLTQENQGVQLVIKDNFGGIKIDPKAIFKQGVSSEKNNTGIGLYIAKKMIVESFQGDISVRNIKDLGAEFSITLPVHRATAVETSQQRIGSG